MLSRKQLFENVGSTTFLELLLKYKLILSTPEGVQYLLLKVRVGTSHQFGMFGEPTPQEHVTLFHFQTLCSIRCHEKHLETT